MELYIFTSNEAQFKYHSGSGGPLNVTGLGYFTPQPIGRSEFQRSFARDKNNIVMPAAVDPAPLYRFLNPTTLVKVEVYGYPDLLPLFTGVVSSCKYDAVKMTADLEVKGQYTLNDGVVPIRTFGTSCSWELFSPDCGVDKTLFGTSFPSAEAIISSDGYTLSHPSIGLQEDGYFNSGFFETEPNVQSQYIIDHTGDTIRFLVPYNLDSVGNTTIVYAGCPKTSSVCKSRYNNFSKFSGYPFIPDKNAVVKGF